MGYSKHAIVKPKGSTTKIYLRLIRTFGMKYWPALLAGVLSSLLIGGAMASALRVMDVSLNVFENGTTATAVQPSSPGAPAVVVAPSESAAVAPNAIAKADTRSEKKSQTILRQVNAVLERCHLEPVNENAALSFSTVMLLMGLLALFFAVQASGEWLNRFTLKWLGARVVADIRLSVFSKMMDQSVGFFARNEVGQLISRCTNDINAVESVMSSSLPELCTAPVFIVVSIQFIWTKAVQLDLGRNFLLTALAIPVCILPVYFISRVLKRYENKILSGVAQLVNRMHESFSGINVIKIFNQESAEIDRFHASNEKFFRRFRKAIAADVLVHPSLQFSALLLSGVFVLLCYRYHVTLGALAIMGFAAQQAYKPIKDLAKINAAIQRSAAAAERIFAVIDTDTALKSPEHPAELKGFEHEIVFKDVSFSYDTSADGKVVLEHINLTIPHGHQVALVGQTGCGKSTMALLMARLYDPVSGSVSIDGVDIRNFRVEDFRRLVGMVSQDTFLFNMSVADNIRYGRPEATMDEVRKAADEANVTEFAERLPGGFDYIVGERGQALSGGQRQRIAIARAILCNPPILILDEATSALDTVTEHLVQEALNNVMKDRTVLAIAHRLSTIQSANQIVVMDNGRILEKGTHQELLGRNGEYAKLYHNS